MENKQFNSEIGYIINKYIELILKSFNKYEEKRILLENYTTQTAIVSNDFFDDKKALLCTDDNLLLIEFNSPIILFNDLKNSTRVLEFFESLNLSCAYTAYIYYSSKMLGEILDLFDGQMIECTGDGNYSIFLQEKINIKKIRKYCNNFIDYDLDFIALEEYKINFEEKEIRFGFNHFNSLRKTFYRLLLNDDIFIRYAFFTIFATFNIEINKYLDSKITNPFLTRVGCMQGNCKISRINIPNHILQDKLIGSIVHKAAHQASGKI
ncbi:hypothetical protein [Aliarcobacter butzleri]|uniref:hypothetical protein n=1 Tax=Aliarcobacter butzleri TaxID=28197 RepID=UPI0012F957F2|nr:hypothetical protein [Aliarcobacter butzleri]